MARFIPQPVGPDIIEFGTSPHYLNKTLSVLQSAILKAIYGLPLTREELLKFLEATEGRHPRAGGYDEVVGVAGIRSGKSDRIGGVIATYEAVRWGPVIGPMLEPGQKARVILIAENQTQAGEIRGYIEGNLQTLDDPACGDGSHWLGGVLAKNDGQKRSITGEAVRLAWPVEIKVYPANRVAVRGATGLAGVLDEIAFWQCGEGAYNQDTKIVKAFRGRFATLAKLHPKRVMISSPDEESGALWDEYRKRDISKALVFKAPSWDLNDTLDQEFLDREQEKDPEGFASEYGAEFRKPGGGNVFLRADSIDRCVSRGVTERTPRPGVEYTAWLDAAFKRDRFSCGVAHAQRETEAVYVEFDKLRHWTPSRVKGAKPLDDDEILAEIVSTMLRPYGIDRIHGDQHCDVILSRRLSAHGISLIVVPASKPEKHEAYKNLRAALNVGQVRLLDDEISLRDLKGLIRKETSDGYTVSAPKRKGSYDDAATVVSRLVMKLLPLSGSLDIAVLNQGARIVSIQEAAHRDWRDPDAASELDPFGGVDIMSAVM